MKTKKIPMRKCVVTNERFEKKALLRVVRTPDGEVVFDSTGKANGRGVYLSKDKKVIEKAQKHNILSKHLNVSVPDEVFKVLLEEVDNG
jgi:hypothetical protein